MDSADAVTLKAAGKVNLSLDIKGKDSCGFHIIDAVAITAGIYDEIRMTKRADGEATVRYSGGERFPSDNALSAALYYIKKFATPGADIFINKKIPVGAGLGGSSADAAGVIRGLEKLYGHKLTAEELQKLGSDVPFLYEGGAARVGGYGEKVEKINLPRLYVSVLYDPRLRIDTRSAYALYDIVGGEHIEIDKFLEGGLERPANSLERAAARLEEGIRELKSAIKEAGFDNVVMTGSGGAVIGYETDANAFAEKHRRLTNLAFGRALYAFGTENL
jgi:4-diphosphocytidyl-2C-methyl-D-erythritol 2-phosphate synthase